ncbi:hypothetical protein [Dictyobacter arantiisoli]|uniref:hypothetical protein n=1 Tax=Dictyobacter arantiisoli TaxID=2014874 RepID=UPI00155AFE14|nr:hypothetical protein [Dictyobacter arantiisoli]
MTDKEGLTVKDEAFFIVPPSCRYVGSPHPPFHFVPFSFVKNHAAGKGKIK